MKLVRGTGVAMVTPFNEDSSLDIISLRRLTHHLIDGGVEFLVVLGSTGEAATLSDEEKETVIRTVMEENDGKVHIMLGCGGNDTAKVAKQISEYTEKFNPHSFLSVSPFYNKPSQQGIVEHFKAISSATNLPIVLYNVPGRTASNVLPATVLQIADECPNVLGIKEASGNIEQGMEIVLKRKSLDFMVYSGDDNLTLPMLASGFDGLISVVGNSHPAIYSEMVRNGLAGNFSKAKEFHYKLFTYTQHLFTEGNPSGIKCALHHLKICGEKVRMPLTMVSKRHSDQIKEDLASV